MRINLTKKLQKIYGAIFHFDLRIMRQNDFKVFHYLFFSVLMIKVYKLFVKLKKRVLPLNAFFKIVESVCIYNNSI